MYPLALLVVLLAACTTLPPTASHAIADAEIGLAAAVKTSDDMLKAACAKPASDACGQALDWHDQFQTSAKVAKASLISSRKQLTTDPASSQSALAVANRVVQDLNAQIQAGVK